MNEEQNKYELLGKTLTAFPTLELRHSDTYSEVVPKIFFLLTTFFKINSKHLNSEGLFRVNGDRQKIEELSVHLQLGNFSILDKFKDCPNEVANFMKEILRSLEHPVCPFEKYPEFRDLSKLLAPQQKLQAVVMLLRELPDINRCTLLYLARFFNEVSTY